MLEQIGAFLLHEMEKLSAAYEFPGILTMDRGSYFRITRCICITHSMDK